MQSFNLNPDHIMSEVYSYPFPEVRELQSGPSLDPRFMLNTLDGIEAARYLEPFGFKPELDLPTNDDGILNLDEIHVPVIERIRSKIDQSLPGIDTFEHAYPTHGSSPAMFNILAEWHAKGELDSIAVLEGEYEGYEAYAGSLNIPVEKHQSLEDAEPTAGQVWFISNPSALDGNWIDAKIWEKFVEAGHEIVYDAAYVGLTGEETVDVSAPNIKAVLTSPSKIFGVFRHRNTGVAYTRDPVASMYGTKWFKDVPALLDTLKLYESFAPNELPKRYQGVQDLICKSLSELVDCDVLPSDVLLLANTQGPVDAAYSNYRRAGGNYRFGLTKLFEDYETA